jgi:hypothetical protein
MALRQLSREEFEAWVNDFSDEEREEMRSLRRWFMRRYPTPAARLAYARRAAADMARTMPPSSEPWPELPDPHPNGDGDKGDP